MSGRGTNDFPGGTFFFTLLFGGFLLGMFDALLLAFVEAGQVVFSGGEIEGYFFDGGGWFSLFPG